MKPGDVVQLVSGPPQMTVIDSYSQAPAGRCGCAWFDGPFLKFDAFDYRSLMLKYAALGHLLSCGPNDLVELRSGGPPMVVQSVRVSDGTAIVCFGGDVTPPANAILPLAALTAGPAVPKTLAICPFALGDRVVHPAGRDVMTVTGWDGSLVTCRYDSGREGAFTPDVLRLATWRDEKALF